MTATPRTVRLRRAASLAGMFAVTVGIVEARAGTAAPVRPVALGAPAGHRAPSAAAARSRTAGGSPQQARATCPARPATSRVRSVLGSPVDIGYGIVQVRLVLRGPRITDVIAVQLPTGGRSADIASFAVPALRSEVLSQQTAAIDTVSGASYTSDGYARSVQAALDAAGAR